MTRGRLRIYLVVLTGALAAVFSTAYLIKMKAAAEPLALNPIALPGADWPTYGGDIQNSFLNNASLISSKNISNLREDWFVRADGEVAGDPVIVGNYVYFTTFGGSVYAVNKDSGRVIWHRKLDGSPVDSGPLYDNHRLFVSTSAGRVFSLSPITGKTDWQTGILFGSLADALRASPRAYNGVIYQSFGGTDDSKSEAGGVAAIDETTGNVLWQTNLVQYAGGGSAVFGTPAIIPQFNELVVATGNPTPYPKNDSPAGRGPLPAGRNLYSDSLVALALESGKVLWFKQVHQNDALDMDFMSAPNVITTSGGYLAVGDGSKDGHYYLVNAKTGGLIWDADLTQEGTTTLVMAPAAAGSDSVFLGTMDVAQSVSNWPEKYQAPASGRIIRLQGATGNVVWSEDLGTSVAAAPVLTNNVLFVVGANGTLFAIDSEDGEILKRFDTGGQIWNVEAALAATDKMIFVPLAKSNGLMAFNLY